MDANGLERVSGVIFEQKGWILSLFVIEIANLAVIFSVMKPGYLINADHPCRLFESWYVAEVLVPEYGKLMGWSPLLFAGFPVLKLGPSFFAIFTVVVAHYLTLRSSIVSAYNLVVSAVYLLFPVSIYYLTWKLKLDWHAAAATSAFACFSTSPFPNFIFFSPFNAVFVVGVWPFTLGMTLAFMATAKFIDLLETRSVWNLLIAGILACLVALTNILTAYMLGCLLTAHVVARLIQNWSFRGTIGLLKNLSLLGLVVTIAVGLAAFWVFPFLADRDYWVLLYADPPQPPARLWVTLYPFVMGFAPLLSHMSGGWIFQYFYDYSFVTIWILGMMGFILTLRKYRSRVLMLVIGLVLGLLFARGTFSPPVTQCLRLLDFVKVVWMFFAGFFVCEASKFFGSKLARSSAPRDIDFGKVVAVSSAILISLLSLWLPYLHFTEDLGLVQTSDSNELMASVDGVYDWLSSNAVDGSSVFFEDTTFWDNLVDPFNDLWFAHAFGAAPIFTGTPNYGGFYGFWYRPYNDAWDDLILGLYDLSPKEAHEKFVYYNVKYAVGFTRPFRRILSNAAYFEEKARYPPFRIYEVLHFTPSHAFLEGGNGEANVSDFSEMRVVVDVNGADQGARLVLRTSGFPNWKAYVNGEETPLSERWPNFVAVTLSEGDSRVILQWEDTLVDSLTRNVSIASWIAAVAALVFLRLRGDRRVPL